MNSFFNEILCSIRFFRISFIQLNSSGILLFNEILLLNVINPSGNLP